MLAEEASKALVNDAGIKRSLMGASIPQPRQENFRLKHMCTNIHNELVHVSVLMKSFSAKI